MSEGKTTPEAVQQIVEGVTSERVGRSRRLARRALANQAYVKFAAALAPVASVATIVLVVRDLMGIKGDGWAIVLAVFVCVCIILVVAALYNEQARHRSQIDDIAGEFRKELSAVHQTQREELAQYERRARMYTTLPHVHQVFHEIRDAQAILMRGTPGEPLDNLVFTKLQTIMSEFAAAFTDLTGVSCRASIKSLEPARGAPDHLELGQDEAAYGTALVSTLARHDRAANRDEVDGAVRITDNTDFLDLLRAPEGGLRCFFSNNLDEDPPDYRNPHRLRDRAVQPKPPYNSTIVWPIQKQRDGQNQQQHFGLVGFLCVDSLAVNCFEKNYDFELGAAVADGLFTLIWFWRSNATAHWPDDVPDEGAETPAPAEMPSENGSQRAKEITS